MERQDVDLYALACAVWLLGRAQSKEFMHAVAFVVCQRSLIARMRRHQSSRLHPFFGNGSLREAAKSLLREVKMPASIRDESTQISPPNTEDREFRRALAASYRVLKAEVPDPTGGALYCHHHTENPRWADRLQPTALIGPLFFYQGRTPRPWPSWGRAASV